MVTKMNAGSSLMNQSNRSAAPSRRVLLVEDDPDHITIARHYLAKLGGRVESVETCSSLAAAESHILGGRFELMLLDLTLPDSMLESTIEAIANLSKGTAKIVAMSSLDVPEIRQKVQDHGAAAFLSKTKLNDKSLTELFDRLDAAGLPAATNPKPAIAAAKAAVKVAMPDGVDAKFLASKLAHDTNSWIANAAFRVAVLRQHGEMAGCPEGQDHLDSISKSLDAIASMVSGSRAVLVDEMTPLRLEAIDLQQRFPKLVDLWRISFPKQSITVDHSGLPMVAADDTALSALFAILANNAVTHGGQNQGAALRIAQGPTPEGQTPEGRTPERASNPEEFVTVTVADSGGPWEIAHPGRITDPTFRGDPASAHPGLGLYRAKRWMERMGGGLEIVERDDVPGAYAAHLHFRRPE